MAEDTKRSTEEPPEGGRAGLPFLFIMLAAMITVVALVVGLVQLSETLMLAAALPMLVVCLVLVLTFVVRLAAEGEEPDAQLAGAPETDALRATRSSRFRPASRFPAKAPSSGSRSGPGTGRLRT